MSDRLRLDLVLNDFVAGALSSGEITILSDGTPWRPLINVRDMGRAIIWAHERDAKTSGNFLIVNTGSNEWNYQVKELAYSIQKILPSVKVSINKDAQPDKRSYKVSFDVFKGLAPDNQPQYQLKLSPRCKMTLTTLSCTSPFVTTTPRLSFNFRPSEKFNGLP